MKKTMRLCHAIVGLAMICATVSCTIEKDNPVYPIFKKVLINPIEAVVMTTVLVNLSDGYNKQEPELMEYLHDFVEDAAIHGLDISYVYDHPIEIKFGDWSDSFMSGLSTGYKDDNKINIFIHKESFSYKSDITKRYLMYHELGHDIFNMKHGDNMMMESSVSIPQNKEQQVHQDFWDDAKN